MLTRVVSTNSHGGIIRPSVTMVHRHTKTMVDLKEVIILLCVKGDGIDVKGLHCTNSRKDECAIQVWGVIVWVVWTDDVTKRSTRYVHRVVVGAHFDRPYWVCEAT